MAEHPVTKNVFGSSKEANSSQRKCRHVLSLQHKGYSPEGSEGGYRVMEIRVSSHLDFSAGQIEEKRLELHSMAFLLDSRELHLQLFA